MGLYSIIEKKKREQKRREKAKIAKVAGITAVVGTSLGVAAGVLFAPKSGKETRADIAEKTVKAKDEIVEKSKVFKENIAVKAEAGKNNLVEAKNKISQYLASKKEGTANELNEINEDLVEETEGNIEE